MTTFMKVGILCAAVFATVGLASPAQAQRYFVIALEADVELDGDGIPTATDLAVAAEEYGVITYAAIFPPEAGNADPGAFSALALDRVYRALLADPDADVDAAVAGHTGLPGVVYVEVDGTHMEHATPNDTLYSQQWGLHNDGTFAAGAVVGADVNAEAVWDLVTWSVEMIVGVLDGGVHDAEPDITAHMWNNAGEVPGNATDDDGNGYVDDIAGWDFAQNDAITQDGTGHGSNVASIVAAFANNNLAFAGVCWHCTILDGRDLNGTSGSYSWAAEAIVYAVDNGAHVLNMSTGGTATSQLLHDAVKYAYGVDVAIVASMGNSNSGARMYPATFPETIAVGATDYADVRASPFSWGGGSNYGDHIDVVAPGQSIYGLSRFSGTYTANWSGTSQATPFVTGLAALLLSVEPTLTVEELRSYIRAGAVDEVGDPAEDTPGWDRYHGAGRIDMEASVLLLMAEIADADSDGIDIRGGDCDDDDPDVYPGADEIADDGIDQDCSGTDAVTCYGDGDSDGSGAGQPQIAAGGDCDAEGWVTEAGDCDDADPTAYPGGVEVCNGIDNDCSGVADDIAACEDEEPDDGGCGCRATGSDGGGAAILLLLALAVIRRRRR